MKEDIKLAIFMTEYVEKCKVVQTNPLGTNK